MTEAIDKSKLVFFDTTLRDGEQSPGATLNVDEKIEIAKQLSALGVDVCEAGFPIASNGDFEAVKRIAQEVGPLMNNRKSGKPMVICGLARAVEGDITRAYEAVKYAPCHRIHTFIATSDIHLKNKLKISRQECIEKAVAAVKLIKSLGVNDIEFSPEDAGRSDKEFLVEILTEVIKAGATTLNIPDTVGYLMPEQYGELINYLVTKTPGGDNVTWSTHCHNDLGLATANTLAGVRNGARQVEVTINGIGERAGNTALEEIALSTFMHKNFFNVHHHIDTTHIYSVSQLVIKRTGMIVQANKAIVGANAFAHESGIHQDGVLKCKETYEIMSPDLVGVPSNLLILGKHSGRNAFRTRIEQLLKESNYDTKIIEDNDEFQKLFKNFKKLADSKKKGVTDQDLYALVDDFLNIKKVNEFYVLKSIHVTSGTSAIPTATVQLIDLTGNVNESSSDITEDNEDQLIGNVITDAHIGHGAVHSIFQAINRLVNVKSVLRSYELKAITEGSDAMGRVVVRISEQSEKEASTGNVAILGEMKEKERLRNNTANVYRGEGADNDVLVASAKAYVNAINRLMAAKSRQLQSQQA
ncbi:putative 2-isopropylmalate synthase [Piromyces sp. E2]|nr:putative 2-isopropylmalate synthase [Piromyces sp. E2]|eukprot:OUM64153.1 putative 2-isopropylmalate synthase [Piromyces sp. E2]